LPLAQTRLRGVPAIGIRRSRLSEFGEPSDELGLRIEHRSCCLVAAVAGSDSSRGLLFPTAHAGWKGPLDRGLCLPAAFRPQGLATLSTVCSLSQPGRFCFAPAALLGLALRSFLLPAAGPAFPPSQDPPTVSGRTAFYSWLQQPRFLGFDPPGNPWQDAARLDAVPAGCSHGLTIGPLQGVQKRTLSGLSLNSSYALGPETALRRNQACALEFRSVRAGLDRDSPCHQSAEAAGSR